MGSDLALPRGTEEAVMKRLFPEPDPWVHDPVGWITQKQGNFLWSKQRDVVESVRDHRYTAVHSAHGTGKSYSAAQLVAWWLETHPPGEAFAVTTAPSQIQVEAILWREIGKAHDRGQLIGRITQGQVPMWKLASGEIVGFGRKPASFKSPEEAAAAFSGIHARFVLVILDEAGGIPKWLWDAVDTLATNVDARVLAIGNPDNPASQFEKVCKPGSGWNTIEISAFDTPAFTGEKVPENLLQLLVSKEWVEERKTRWGESSPLYTSKVLGLFPDITDDTLITPAMIRAAQELDLSGEAVLDHGVMGADVARYGADETCIYLNRAGMLRHYYSAHKQDTMATAGAFKNCMRDAGGDVPMWIDSIGVGAGVFDRMREQSLEVFEFIANARAFDPTRFKDRKAEAWWGVRTMLEDGLLDLPPDGEDDDFIAQLGSVRYRTDSAGRTVVESKDDMKKRGLPSPDRADAAIMSTLGDPPEAVAAADEPGVGTGSITAGIMKQGF